MSEITVTDVGQDEFDAWRPLFEGYADFYGTALTDAAANQDECQGLPG